MPLISRFCIYIYFALKSFYFYNFTLTFMYVTVGTYWALGETFLLNTVGGSIENFLFKGSSGMYSSGTCGSFSLES